MHSDKEPVQPTRFDAAQPAVAADPQVAALDKHTAGLRWILPALIVLVLMLLAVIFWLPGQVSPPSGAGLQGTPDANPAPQSAAEPQLRTADSTPPASAAGAPAASSPWEEGQQARLRADAQNVLEKLLDTQFQLEESGVEHWAGERFVAALATAQNGDKLYQQRRFAAAEDAYGEALKALEALQADLEGVRTGKVEIASKAIAAGDQVAAIEALDLAEQMAPGRDDLPPLRQRAENIPAMRTLLQQALAAEEAGNLGGARDLLDEATALDPDHEPARRERQRLGAALARQQFNTAMSEGYSALDAGQFSTARTAFQRAAQLQPGSPEAKGALDELASADTAQRLAKLQARGKGLEAQEQWQQATAVYQQALKIDSAVLFANEGLARSKPRAVLHKALSEVLDEPKRLEEAPVAREAENLLAEARQVNPAGKVLSGQINRLAAALEKANTPVTIAIHSDMETDVIVYKVARLGRFLERELTLRPGTYTALGTRVGYRDVRRKFTVAADGSVSPVTIACTEPI